jgi:hypothetical protein
MTATLITLWLMADGGIGTQAIPMRSMEACLRAKRVLIEYTLPIVRDDGFLEQVQFDCLAGLL